MKKVFKVLGVILIVCFVFSAFVACGGEKEKGKTVDQVTSIFKEAGYTVNSQTLAGISALVAVKGTDTLTVLFYESEKLATDSKSTWDTTAQAVGQSCKQDKSNIYYGTAAAIAVYEA